MGGDVIAYLGSTSYIDDVCMYLCTWICNISVALSYRCTIPIGDSLQSAIDARYFPVSYRCTITILSSKLSMHDTNPRPLSLTGRRYRTFSSDPRANSLHRGVYATMVHHFLYSCVHSDKKITMTGIPRSIHIYHKNIMWVVSHRNFHPVVVQDTLNNTVRFAVIKDGQRRNRSLRGHITEHSNLPEKSGRLSLE